MDNIVIQIRNRCAQLMTQSFIVNGNADYAIEFNFDDEWDEFEEKTARFVYCDKQGTRHWIDTPIENGVCNIPKLKCIDRVYVGVYAGNICASTGAAIPCACAITDAPSAAYTQQTDIYNRIMDTVADIMGGSGNA